jgi:predicted nucleic acid-binding protein
VTFVDTSGVYAAIDRQDPNHVRAAQTFALLVESGEPLVTTNYVVTELIALTQARFGLDVVKVIPRDLLADIDVAYVDEALHATAIGLLLTASQRQLSLVDCASITYMRRNGITRVFAYDSDFERFGFSRV